MTEQEEKALRYDKRQRGLVLKKRVATIGERLKEHAAEWSKLGRTFIDYESYTFRSYDGAVKVLNRKHDLIPKPLAIPGIKSGTPSYNEVLSVDISVLDSAALIKLLDDLEEAKQELSGIREFLQKIEEPLD